MKPTVEISEAIERELLSWPDVTVGQHRFGGREFRIGKREIGHLHGSSVADLRFRARCAMNSFPAAKSLRTITGLTRGGSVSTCMAKKTFLSRSPCFGVTTSGSTPSCIVRVQRHPFPSKNPKGRLKLNMKTSIETNQASYETAAGTNGLRNPNKRAV